MRWIGQACPETAELGLAGGQSAPISWLSRRCCRPPAAICRAARITQWKRSSGTARCAVSVSRCGGSPAATLGAAAATIRCPRAWLRSRRSGTAAAATATGPQIGPDRDGTTNLLIAIVLSVGILIAFQFVFERMRPPQPPGTAPGTPATAPATPTNRPGDRDRRRPPRRFHQACQAPCRHKRPRRARRRSPSSRGSRSTRRGCTARSISTGARLDDLTLANYHETVDPEEPGGRAAVAVRDGEPLSRRIRLGRRRARDVKVPGPQTRWTASGGPLTPANPVTLTWDNGQGLVFTRTISVDENYMFTVRDSVRNTGSAPVKLLPYGLISRTGTPQVAGYYILFEGLIGYLDGSLQEVKVFRARARQAARLRVDRRLARLYRQILVDRAHSAAERGDQGALHPHGRRRGGSLSDRLSRVRK